MQFTLKKLLCVFIPVACISWAAGLMIRHWDLKSYYLGFYGSRHAPFWATGTGADEVSETLGSLMGAIWMFGPWPAIAIFAVAAAIYGAQVKGGAR